ncbi:conserved hypothetical protein [Talaromyces stipitatus ATCC 10500]|uniref:Alcohol acetyltransferase n=1 Tax=Talaromyces stipitatus (strain ATCC 10500 / CBS 375.48 / QM 6759 / NRRL 1006) TaxID=441959 RepID=B8MM57_TALSN|nr:uncharacterized protein TSTA_098260 [Talaromyces stipitatus ATCC 10500]EED13569.1 conserved hypothetical protein [Talaromyces stipitatus ATCC 10500]
MSKSIAGSLEKVRSLAVSAVYTNSSPIAILHDLIFSALENVIQEHAILGVIPVGEDMPNPHFARLPQFDLQNVVTFVEREKSWDPDTEIDPELDEILEREHNQSFKQRYGELPFWRLVILHTRSQSDAGSLPQFTACFVVHHAIGDGLSGIAFHRSFLSALGRSDHAGASRKSPGDNNPYLVTPARKDLIPCLEALHPLPISILYILGTIWRELVPRWSGTVWTAKDITDDPDMKRSRFKSYSISASKTSKIIEISRGKNTTVTGVIEAILVYTVFNLLPKNYTILKVAGPISLRPILPSNLVDNNSIGTWSNSYVQEHNRPISDSAAKRYSYIWDEAVKVRTTIKGELAKEGRNVRTGLLKFVGDSHKFFQKNIGRPRGESIELSNLGVFSVPDGVESSGWKVCKVLFSQAGNVVGSPLEVTLATGPNGRLNVGFSWLEGIVKGTWVEMVMNEFKGAIEELVIIRS